MAEGIGTHERRRASLTKEKTGMIRVQTTLCYIRPADEQRTFLDPGMHGTLQDSMTVAFRDRVLCNASSLVPHYLHPSIPAPKSESTPIAAARAPLPLRSLSEHFPPHDLRSSEGQCLATRLGAFILGILLPLSSFETKEGREESTIILTARRRWLQGLVRCIIFILDHSVIVASAANAIVDVDCLWTVAEHGCWWRGAGLVCGFVEREV